MKLRFLGKRELDAILAMDIMICNVNKERAIWREYMLLQIK